MSYWGSRDASVDNFEGYDPTPYSGGYDLSLTYGRALQPSDEICYPLSATVNVELDQKTSAFETQKSDCYGLLRPGLPLRQQPLSNIQEFRSEYETGRKPQYYGYGREEPKHYGEEEGCYGPSGYRRTEEQGYVRQLQGYGVVEDGSGGYNKSSYGGDESDYQSTGYMKPTYYGGGEEGYGHSKYGNDSYDVEKKHSHQKHHQRHY